MIIILITFTFGIYYLYWVYQVTYEIKDITNDENLNSEKETLLNIIPFYPIFWLNKIGKIVYIKIPNIIGEKI
ncbi:hypothetical protein A966_13028 [Brachyspira hampsonii 30446]|uniref:DUF4234 domain-containing protein n=1 Tax=Brachyspira hampsonii 30446 TaxID=1289135 RepID=A0A2U4EZG1_9SPIR|nr:hypothetical protein A966_13028 [Brachyspira hampsonii 30446]OEJ17920.1 hypothetical protein A9495_06660 [Brachyspira hampsonii]